MSALRNFYSFLMEQLNSASPESPGLPGSPDVDSSISASTPPPAPVPETPQQKNQKANVENAEKEFGSTGARLNELRGAAQLNTAQKSILDNKLKLAIQKAPGAQDGPLSEDKLKELAQKTVDVVTALAKTPLNASVNTLSLKSPTLKDNIVDLQNRNWKIVLVDHHF